MSQRVSPLTTMYLLQGFVSGGGGGASVGSALASTVGSGVGSGVGSSGGGTSTTGAGVGTAGGGATASFARGWVGTSTPSIRFLLTQPMDNRNITTVAAKKNFELFIPFPPWRLQPPVRILWEQSPNPS